MDQLALLPDEIAIADEAKKRTHRNDPVTSLLAALEMIESGAMGAQRKAVLAALQEHPGLTSDELARAVRGDRPMFARRLPELAWMGLATQGARRKSEVSERLAVTWWPRSGTEERKGLK